MMLKRKDLYPLRIGDDALRTWWWTICKILDLPARFRAIILPEISTKMISSVWMVFVDTVTLWLMLRDASIMAVIVKWQRKKLMLILWNFGKNGESFIIGKGFEIVEVWECLWWKQARDDKTLKVHLKINFPFRKLLSEHQLLQQIDNGSLFGYVHCDLSVPKSLQSYFQHFLPIFKDCFVSKSDFGEYMKPYAD